MKQRVKDTPNQPVGMYAVMRHSSKLSRAHFSGLHATYQEASSEAVRLLAMSLEKDPQWDHSYYVMEIAARFDAGPSGLKSSER